MKKLLLPLFCAFVFTSVNAQEFWFEAGLKGGVGYSFLYNKNIADDNNWDYQFTPMYGVGAKFSVNFGPYNGVVMEGIYNQSQQDFSYKTAASTQDIDYSVKWKSIDTYLLYRGIRNRAYFEIGPMLSLVQEVTQGNGGETFATTTDFYNSTYLAGVLGVGGYIVGTETFSIGIGMRFHYGFGDFVNDAGQKANYPNPVNDQPYQNAENTSPAFAQFLVEFNFGVGRFAKTACSERFKRIRRR